MTVPLQLDEIELRVLGVLMEKSLTQANAYPLTLNSLVLGVNQKQNRDPVVNLTENEVAKAIQRLQHKHLVKQAPPHAGERANKFLHAVLDVFGWDKREQAVMAELMIRGRQTPGELRTHASRMWPFDDLASVATMLEGLLRRERPVVEELAREPGRSANRWRQLLGAESAGAGAAAHAPLSQTETAAVAQQDLADAEMVVALTQRVERLEAHVVELAQWVEQLRRGS